MSFRTPVWLSLRPICWLVQLWQGSCRCSRLALRFQGHPDINGCYELTGRGLAHVDAFCRDEFASFKIEADPRFRHAGKLHLLDGPTGGRVHDCRDDAHSAAATDQVADLSSFSPELSTG